MGYRQAAKKAQEILDSIAISASDKDTLVKVAMTAMTGKGTEKARKPLAELVVEAVKQVEENGEVDKDHIKIEKKEGGSVDDSMLVQGVIIDKERVHPGMPKKVENAKIALLNCPIEVKETEVDAEIRITDPSQMQAFIEQEEKMIKDMVDKIVSTGVNVLFCQKGIDDLAQHYLAKAGVLAVRRVKKSDIEKLSKATGAKIVTNIEDLSEEDLGNAGRVVEKKISGEEMIFVEECKEPKAVTILVRGSTEHVVSVVERAIEDAIGVVSATVEDGKVVAGGGAPEVEIAEALEVVPKTLAENAGLDSIDTLVDLRAAHEESPYMGLNVFEGEVVDMKEAGVLEPHRVKKQAIQSAAEAAEMILRIDDMIAAKGFEVSKKESEEGGGMEGMGGMPPM